MKTLKLAVLLALIARTSGAVETASFLNVGVGARGLAMGGAYTAMADDADAIYWNPAGLAQVAGHEFQVSDAELTQSTREDFFSYAQTAGFGTFAVAGTYFDDGTLDGRDTQGHPTGSFSAADAAATNTTAAGAAPAGSSNPSVNSADPAAMKAEPTPSRVSGHSSSAYPAKTVPSQRTSWVSRTVAGSMASTRSRRS